MSRSVVATPKVDGVVGCAPPAHAHCSEGRFLHYLTRFEHHQRARDEVIAARTTFAEELTAGRSCYHAMTAPSYPAIDCSPGWLVERDEYSRLQLRRCLAALLELDECRRVLAYSYVFAYHMPDRSRRHLFEHLQEMLEKHTEFLHEMVLPGRAPVRIVSALCPHCVR